MWRGIVETISANAPWVTTILLVSVYVIVRVWMAIEVHRLVNLASEMALSGGTVKLAITGSGHRVQAQFEHLSGQAPHRQARVEVSTPKELAASAADEDETSAK
jgi:hypothetical protein